MKKMLPVTCTSSGIKSSMFAICFLLAIVTVMSCSKTSVSANRLAGKWYIINDYIPVDRSGVLSAGGGIDYIGTGNDYYNFTADNILYRKEGLHADTATYSLSDDQLTLVYYPNEVTVAGNTSGFGGRSGTYLISDLTSTTMTVTTSFWVQGGEETEIISLKK